MRANAAIGSYSELLTAVRAGALRAAFLPSRGAADFDGELAISAFDIHCSVYRALAGVAFEKSTTATGIKMILSVRMIVMVGFEQSGIAERCLARYGFVGSKQKNLAWNARGSASSDAQFVTNNCVA
ncbi:hypothetical protein [Caballeronia sp. J97]|uniref:hypothetical protein n=1 Tax=Caballeronia sp. J97 TaxID=2805429 RepID=UPI002AB14542|nr:hypothetical protein [Caballeronia sp. J97]